MHSFLYDYEENHKAELNQYLSDKRKDGNFKVLDVGGSVGHWFWDKTDVIFDIIPPTTAYGTTFSGEYISGNATLPEGWKKLNDYIKNNGSCIC